jgi:hypothetical protein
MFCRPAVALIGAAVRPWSRWEPRSGESRVGDGGRRPATTRARIAPSASGQVVRILQRGAHPHQSAEHDRRFAPAGFHQRSIAGSTPALLISQAPVPHRTFNGHHPQAIRARPLKRPAAFPNIRIPESTISTYRPKRTSASQVETTDACVFARTSSMCSIIRIGERRVRFDGRELDEFSARR